VKTIIHKVSPYGHCATVCSLGDGILVAYYNGPECTDKQAVNVEYWENDKKLDCRILPPKTGNPVLISMNSKEACLIFSYFQDTDGVNVPTSAVQRWMFCSNWKTKVSVKDNKLQFSREERFSRDNETEGNIYIGYLMRCAPIKIKKTWYLPIYREHNCYGQIYTSKDGYRWSPRGKIGDNINQVNGRFGSGVLIQPTIWYDTKLKSLSRDITSKMRAWYSESNDLGWTWSKPIQTRIWNDNNSIVVINDSAASSLGSSYPLAVWNEGPGRSRLMLGRLKGEGEDLHIIPIVMLNKGNGASYHGASYPNYCVDKEGRIHIIFSERSSGSIVRLIRQDYRTYGEA
jgi:hypothetical protein